MNLHTFLPRVPACLLLLLANYTCLAAAKSQNSKADLSIPASSESPVNPAEIPPEICASATPASVSIVYPWQGNLELGSAQCIEIELNQGEFIRAVVEMEIIDFDDLAGFEIDIYSHGQPNPVMQSHVSTETFLNSNISWEAKTSGSYFIVLRDLYIWPMTTSQMAAQRPGPPPDSEKYNSFLQILDETVAALEAAPDEDEESSLWAEALRGLGCHAKDEQNLGGQSSIECYRDTQMAKHLIWLANHRYSERKMIVWAATPHIMRDPDLRQAGSGTGPAMGKLIWDEFGNESYSIGMTSYIGTENQIIPDQHFLPEFEQLMNEAGFEHAFVDFRQVAQKESWLNTPFPARPAIHHTEVRRWSNLLDAFFFVREQEPRRAKANPEIDSDRNH